MKQPLFAVALSSLMISGLAIADHDAGPTGTADVKSVEPVTKLITTRTPYEECWEEDREVVDRKYGRGHGRHHRSSTPSLIGALIGGGIGNALGHHSSNQKVGAVVGAMLGASIAKDIQHDNRHGGSRTVRRVTEEVCEVSYRESQQEKIVGYRVAYEYGGNIYHTTLDQDPGDTLPVFVNVQPAL
jgi:uncharacterized protein YcfJ